MEPKELLKPIKLRWMLLSFALALLIELLPFGGGATRFIPDFVGMLVLYWTLNQPSRFGIGWAFCLGLLADAASASVFGQHALAYSVMAYLVIIRQRQFILYNLGQQTLVVLALLLVGQALMTLARLATGAAFAGWGYFMAPFIGAVLWPLLTNILIIPQRRGTPG